MPTIYNLKLNKIVEGIFTSFVWYNTFFFFFELEPFDKTKDLPASRVQLSFLVVENALNV